MTAPYRCGHNPRCKCADYAESSDRQLCDALNDRNGFRAVLQEWHDARRDLRKWLEDKETPRDDIETDRRYRRVEDAEKAAHSALVPRPVR